MRWAITHPAGVDRALGQSPLPDLPARFQEPAPRRLDVVDGDARLGPELRLSVYSSGYFDRLLAALEADHPALLEALGRERFRELVGHHLLARPSTSPSLADLGQGLDGTLEGLEVAAELPWTVDLARVERSQVEVWLTEAGGPTELHLPADADWAGVHLRLSPTLRLLRTQWSVDRWLEDRTPPRSEVRWLAIWRTAASKGVVALEAAGWATLHSLASGASLGEACARAEEEGAAPDALLEEFARWVQRGWIAQAIAPSSADNGP